MSSALAGSNVIALAGSNVIALAGSYVIPLLPPWHNVWSSIRCGASYRSEGDIISLHAAEANRAGLIASSRRKEEMWSMNKIGIDSEPCGVLHRSR